MKYREISLLMCSSGAVRRIPAMTPTCDVRVDDGDLLLGAAKVLQEVRPRWENSRIKFKVLTDGITNKLVKCSYDGVPDHESVLVRVYGNKTDLLIDRDSEITNIVLLNKVNLAPRLFATFQNGLAYEFVPGCTLDDKKVRDPSIYSLVSAHMAKLHQFSIKDIDDPAPVLWSKLNDFLELVPDVFTDANKHKRYTETVMSKRKIETEIGQLKARLSELDSPVVFCHNDLLLGNVVYTEEKNSVTFIDFEYAAFNYQAFDIGNHFVEFAGVDTVDYSRYPNKELQYDWLRKYTLAFKGSVCEKDLDTLYVQVNQFALASHVLWGLWALIQAEHSSIDFDFMGYAAIRFDEYLRRKEEFLSLELPR